MKISESVFEKLRKRIHSDEFKSKHRISEKAFTRNSILNFSFLVIFIINLLKKSLASEISSSRHFLNKVKSFSKSALSKARLKLSPNAFIELNEILTDEYYKRSKKMKRFLNFIIFAIDGSKLQLPESTEIREVYGYSSNQTNSKMNMGLASQLVDVLTGIVLHALLCPFNSSERDLAIMHINAFILQRANLPCLNQSIIIFDRGYPSAFLLVKLFYNNIQFLMRSNTVFLKEINDFVATGRKDGIVKLKLKNLSKSEKEKILKECPDFDFNLGIRIRVVVVKLSTGENEILLTSLLDCKKYKYKEFKKFYFLRWGIEGQIGFEKIRTQIENFSGKSCIAVEQDFHAAILNTNMTTILALEAKEELDQQPNIQNRKHEYEINYSTALAYMKNRFMCALLDQSITTETFCLEIKALMIKNIEPIRPGRKFEHKCKYPNKRYPTNTRAVI